MKRIVYILLGVAVGIWAFLSQGTLVVTLFGVITGYIILKNALNNAERKFLGWVFVIVFLLSMIFSSLNFYSAALTKNTSDLLGDVSAYSTHGAYIAEVLTNKKCNIERSYTHKPGLTFCRNKYKGKLPNYSDYRMGFFSYFYGFLYTLFGYSPIIIKFINSILGIIGCFLIYFWIRDAFGETQAKIALLLVLFWPSRFIWAISGLKDAFVFFSFSLVLFTFLRLQKNFGLVWTCAIFFAAFIEYNFVHLLFLLIIATLLFNRKKAFVLLSSFIFVKLAYILVYGIRAHFVGPLMIVLGISLSVFLTRRKIPILTCLVALSSFLLLFKIDKDVLKEQYRYQTFLMIGTQRAQAQAGEYAKSKYKIYPNRFYDRSIPLHEMPPISFKELFISYLVGMGYHFLSPFPWSLGSKMQAFGYVQTVWFYLLLPFIIIGIIIGLRYRWRETFPYCLLILVIASVNSLFLGNVGTLFRHRDMIMPFFIAFAAIGLTRVLRLGNFAFDKIRDER